MNARFEKLYNDLFWSIYDLDSDKIITWRGYNDSFWWNNVARTESFQVRGKYRLNPFTNEVTELKDSGN